MDRVSGNKGKGESLIGRKTATRLGVLRKGLGADRAVVENDIKNVL